MAAKGEAGRINIADAVTGHVMTLFELEPRGSIQAKRCRICRVIRSIPIMGGG